MEITHDEFRQFSDYIHDKFGIFLKDEKKSLLSGRLRGMLEQQGFNSFSEYFEHVVNDRSGTAEEQLVNKISTNYSFFMRESEHFYFFRDCVLPYFENRINDYDLRVWSAGCATGEEPYTLAFILAEYFKNEGLWDKTILATDISRRALQVAAEGMYEKKQIASLPAAWKINYFDQLGADRFMVKEKIRREVLFRPFNLVTDAFRFRKPFHAIFLRNVMIYFDKQTQLNLIRRMYELTAPGGYLFLGHSEAIGVGQTRYKYVMPAVYRKI